MSTALLGTAAGGLWLIGAVSHAVWWIAGLRAFEFRSPGTFLFAVITWPVSSPIMITVLFYRIVRA